MFAPLEIALGNAVVASLLALLAFAVGRICRRPALTHSLWLLVLLKLLTPPMLQIPIASRPADGDGFAAVQLQVDEGRRTEERFRRPNISHGDEINQWGQASEPTDQSDLVDESPIAAAPASTLPSARSPAAGPRPVETSRTGSGSAAAEKAAARNPRAIVAAFLAFVWIAGSILLAILAVARIVRFHRLLKDGMPAPGWLRDEVERLAERIGLKRLPTILLVGETISPLTWSLGRKPQLILPEKFLERMGREERESTLLHELFHIRRHDDWVRFLELAASCCYWWHPVVWWARREIQWSEEACCDACVVWHSSSGGRPYANALLAMVDFLSDTRSMVPPVASGFGRVGSLKRRLTMIMEGTTPRRLSGMGRLAVIAIAVCFLPLWPSVGQERSTAAEATAATDKQTDQRPDAKAPAAEGEAKEPQPRPEETGLASLPALPEPTTFEKVAQSFALDFQTIRSVAFSSDGRLLAVAHGDHRTEGTVRIWDMQRKKEIASWEEPAGINSVHISPDGRLVAFSSLADKLVTIGSIESGDDILKIATGSKPARVRFSPDGKTLVTASTGGELKLWNVEDGKESKSLASLSFNLQCVAFSPDGTRIVAAGGPFRGDNFGWAGVWEVASGKQIAEIKDMADSVLGIAISPDGKVLATAGRDGAARLWETETGKLASTFSGHQSALEWVDFSPDGKMLASASYDDTAKLWNVGDGAEVATLPGHRGAVLTTRFSPDGKTLATGGADGVVRLWDVATREQTGVLEPDATLLDPRSAVLSIACSPDGKTIASAHVGKSVRLRDARTGRVRRVLGELQADVSCVAFSPDSKTLATAGCDNTVKLWKVAGDGEPVTLTGHTDWVLSVAFAPDGKTVASSGSDKTVRLWDVETGKQAALLEGHAQMVRCLAFSPDGKLLASGSTDATVRLWDVKSQSETSTLEGRSGGALAFSPDGSTLATVGEDRAIILRDTATGNERRVPGRPRAAIWCLAFSPRGATLAAGVSDGTIALWDPDSLKGRASLRGHSDSVTSLVFTPDTSALISASSDQTIKLWKSRQPPAPPLATLQAAEDKHSCRFVILSPDGRLMVTGGNDKVVKVWDMQTGQRLRTLEGHDRGSTCGAFSPDGKLLATGTWGNVVLLWDPASGDQIGQLTVGHDYVLRVEFSPDGSQLAVSTWNKTVSLCDVQSRKELWASPEQSLAVTGVSFSPDGKTLVTTTGDKNKRELGGEAKLWDAGSGKELGVLPGHTDMVAPALFSADGRLLFTGSADAMLRIWDVESREVRTTVSTPRAVQCLALLPDGKSVLTAHYGGRVSRWDIESGQFLAEYEGPAHTVSVFQVSCSPDGSLVATASTDGAIRLWPTLPTEEPGAATSAERVRGWAISPLGRRE